MQTWAEVNGGIDALEGSTLEITHTCSICGEQDHLISQMRAEQLAEMSHVIIITGKVTAVFILYLCMGEKKYVFVLKNGANT